MLEICKESQAKVCSRVFIQMPSVYGELFPEFKEYCGVPLKLIKSMYGMTLSGKWWYQELQEYLISNQFDQSTIVRCLFCKVYLDGSVVSLLEYVDNMLYYGTIMQQP